MITSFGKQLKGRSTSGNKAAANMGIAASVAGRCNLRL